MKRSVGPARHYRFVLLGAAMLTAITVYFPEWLTGFIGILIIAAAIPSPITYNRKHGHITQSGCIA